MIKNKNAARSAANTQSGGGVENGRKPINHDEDYTTENQRRQGFIESMLLHGEINAIPATMLAQRCGVSSTRHIRALVDAERSAGAVILSSGKGYFLPSDDEAEALREIWQFIDTMRARAFHTFKTMSSANSLASQLCNKNQLRFEDCEL